MYLFPNWEAGTLAAQVESVAKADIDAGDNACLNQCSRGLLFAVVFVAVFFAAVFLGAVFLAAGFFAAAFLAGVFVAAFLEAVFFTVFFVAVFVVFLAISVIWFNLTEY